MSYFDIYLLSIALSVDACVVSFSRGLLVLEDSNKERSRLAFVTAAFQALMPVIGYCLTSLVITSNFQYAKLLAALIFVCLGIKFIVEAFLPKKNNLECLDLFCLILIGVGTSIDAFAAGITLKLSGNCIFMPAALIGVITFINSQAGFLAGEKLKRMPSLYMEIIAGIILIILGIKALI